MKGYFHLLVVLVIGAVTPARSQTPRDFKNEAAQLVRILEQNHYKLPVLDDKFSSEVLDALINKLDRSHLYFDQKDIRALGAFRDSLDDEWKGRRWEFLNRFTEIYRNALKRGGPLLTAEVERPIQWETTEDFIPEGRKAPWSADEQGMKIRWRLWMKYQTLSAMADLQDSSQSVKDLSFLKAHEKKVKSEVGRAENKRLRRILDSSNGFENYVASAYFRIVAAYYDPHSLYLSPQEFENFKEAVSTKEYSFGLGLNEDQNGNVFIEYLIPGGPAWTTGQLHKGDVLLEAKWNNETFDLAAIGLEELLDLMDRANPQTMQLTVSQSGGLHKTVSLKKEKISTEENTVKGFVLSGAKKVGYISLPGFYTTWDSDDRSSCANDVALEIMKLKGENIEALILDIRSNGGGSLKEAIEMAGIFIDEGPLLLMQDKIGKLVTIKDVNRGTIWNGPLIILINGQSASASEILAGAIQDYRRGVIVGGASFGKASGQLVFSLDPGNPQPSDLRPDQSAKFGYATVTLHRLYRITGKSNQGIGVTPDILLPDLYSGALFHEFTLPHAFLNDSVDKKVPFRYLPPLPTNELRQLSMKRTSADSTFRTIGILETRIAEEEAASSESVKLKWQNFFKQGSSGGEESLKTQPTSLYEVTSPEFNKARIEMDSYLKEFTKLWISNLKEDPYVEESYRIACDYIKLTSKK